MLPVLRRDLIAQGEIAGLAPGLTMNPLPPQICRWHVYPDAATLTAQAAEALSRLAQSAIARHGAFRIVLAGGTTPRPLYEALRAIEADWPAWHVYYGDERCLPPDHAQRNSRMADEAWLHHVAIPRTQIHPIAAERGASAAARDYAALLHDVDVFDLVLLGLGEDGHTASLFPGHDWGTQTTAPAVLAVHEAPKPPPERVSLSAWRLSRARHVMFLVSGASKREAVAAWRAGKPVAARAITPPGGVDVWITHDALPAG
jgi:6-phosphogluconolactonase